MVEMAEIAGNIIHAANSEQLSNFKTIYKILLICMTYSVVRSCKYIFAPLWSCLEAGKIINQDNGTSSRVLSIREDTE